MVSLKRVSGVVVNYMYGTASRQASLGGMAASSMNVGSFLKKSQAEFA